MVGAVGSNSVEDDSRSRFETLELEKDHQVWLLSLSSSSSSKVAAAAVPRSSADAVVVRPVNSFSIFFFFVERLTKVETGKKTLKTLNTKSLFLFPFFSAR